MARYCVKCGTPIDQNDRFCSKCGQPVAAAPSQAQNYQQPQQNYGQPGQQQNYAQTYVQPQQAYQQSNGQAMAQPPKRSRTPLILMIIALVLITLFLVLFAIAGFVKPGWFTKGNRQGAAVSCDIELPEIFL